MICRLFYTSVAAERVCFKMRRKRIAEICVALTTVFIIGIMYMNTFRKGPDTSYPEVYVNELIYESSVSPNEEYVTRKEDTVFYEVRIYQKKDNSIVVCASSNSAFFDELQYVLDYDKKISQSDITVLWTTLMGNPKATEEDQIAVADVSIFSENQIISERKINFFNKGIDIITDSLKKK